MPLRATQFPAISCVIPAFNKGANLRRLLTDIKALCEKAGLREGSNADPGEFVIEKAFVG